MALGQLLGFMRGRGVESFDRVDRRLASVWLRSFSTRKINVAKHLTEARGFFRYLCSLDAVKENVWDSFRRPKCERFIPYIFSLAELRTILDHARGQIASKRPSHPHTRAAYYTMFHTVYACGLRAGEVCRLKIGDVDFERSLFVVRKTKFGKTRLVPFNLRTRELIEDYLRRFRRRDDGAPPAAPLFLGLWRKGFHPHNFGAHFRRVCKIVGVYRPKRVERNTVYGSTNVHALRHTFAVHRLLKWYEEGADVNAKLPILATYMGHSDFRNTQVYLRILPRFIDIAGRLFADRFETPLKDLE